MTTPIEPGIEGARAAFHPLLADIARGAAERDVQRALPDEHVEKLAAAGIGLLRVPATEGGFGLTIAEAAEVLVDIATADANLPQIFRGHIALVEDLLARDDAGPWWERFRAREFFGNAWSEAGEATVGTLATKVARDGDDWRLHGEKYYTTGSIFADWLDVTAEDEDGNTVVALVERRAAGVSVFDDWTGFGQRGTGTGTAKFDNVSVPAANVSIFTQRSSYQTATYQLVLLIVHAAVAQRLHDDVRDTLRRRSRAYSHGNANRAADDAQLLAIVGELHATAFQARAIVHAAASALDQAAALERQRPSEAQKAATLRAEIATADGQVVLSEVVPRAATIAFNALGASALDTDLALDRHWRNARAVASHNPVLYKARQLGDYSVNGRVPEYVWSIGQAKTDAPGS